jgi:predicted Zn-dependent protease
MGAFRAELMDGASGRVEAVQVIPEPDRLLIESGNGSELEPWLLAGLQVDPLPGGVLHLAHPAHPGALLSSSDPGLRDLLVAAGATPRSPAGRSLLLRGLFYAAIVAGAVALFIALVPAMSAGIARRVPLSIEEQLAFPVHKLLESRYCRSAESRRALVALADSLRLAGDPEFAGARFEIVDLGMVNAFTFPGGSIVVTRGLVDDARRPEELAGVLAHELEHVARRHVMAQIVRSVILTTGWHLTAGDFAGLMAIDPSTTLEIASRRFSRDAEKEADEGALRRLRHANLSSRGLSDFFARIEQTTDVIPEWLSTHPPSAARRKAVEDADAAAGQSLGTISQLDWQAIKDACRGRRRAESDPQRRLQAAE